MILSGEEIWDEISKGRLSFEPPVQLDQVDRSSVDLRLSDRFTVLNLDSLSGEVPTLDLTRIQNIESVIRRNVAETIVPDGQYITLRPWELVLAYTREYITLPGDIAARVEGKSTFARVGISIHQTAPTVQAAWEGQLRLEILNTGPWECRVYPGMRFCQLVLERLGSPVSYLSGGSFQGQSQNQ